jgi:hypothetical protein
MLFRTHMIFRSYQGYLIVLHTKERSDLTVKYNYSGTKPSTSCTTRGGALLSSNKYFDSNIILISQVRSRAQAAQQGEERFSRQISTSIQTLYSFPRYEAEHKVHNKGRSASLCKYFSEKVAPGIHDGTAKQEAFWVWKEQFLHRGKLQASEQGRLTNSSLCSSLCSLCSLCSLWSLKISEIMMNVISNDLK